MIPLFSIIIAVKDGRASIERCIRSVLEQTFASWELLVVDGLSRDGTQEIVEHYSDRLSYWVSESDSGLAEAWNKALRRVRGEWVCFLGADDFLWSSRTLECAASALAEVPARVRVAYGRVHVVAAEGGIVDVLGARSDRSAFGAFMSIPHQGVFHRRALFESVGEFDTSFRIAADYELLLRELDHGAAFALDLDVAGMTHGGLSRSPELSLVVLREFRRAQRLHGGWLPHPRLLWRFGKAFVKVGLTRTFGRGPAIRVVNAYRSLSGRSPYPNP